MTQESTERAIDAPEELLPWPPPGLARIQGDLSTAGRKMGIAGLVLVVPLLAALTLPGTGEGLGPFGDSWWVLLITTGVGFGLFVDALVMCVRLARRVRAASMRGYSTRIIALVAADEDRTGGFLLQGAHAFSTIPPEVRLVLARVRVLSGLIQLGAMCWFTIGFGVCLLLAARGALSPSGLAVWTLMPVVAAWSGAMVLRAIDASLTRRARNEWHRHAWSEDLVREEIAGWRAAAEARGLTLRVPALRRGRVAAAVALLVVGSVIGLVPTVALVPASSMGAVLSSLMRWNASVTVQRAAVSEAFRSYRLEPDPSIGAEEAGDLLRILTTVSGAESEPGLRDAPRTHTAPWFAEPAPEGWPSHVTPLWSDSVWLHADRGLSPDLRAYLEEVAAHPAHEDFSRLARASSLAFVEAFYERPFDPSVAFYELPIPRFAGIRSGASAHVAAAALLSADGRHDDARRMAREVISVGFLLLDESPFPIGAILGSALTRIGADALYHATRRAGDDGGASALRVARDGAERAASLLRASAANSRASQAAYLERARTVTADPAALRAIRWEMTHTTAVVAPCLNVRSIVFGPGPEYDAWLEEVRASLVRTPAEAELFDVVARGLVLEGDRSGPLGRVLAAAMGGGDAPSSCANVIGTLRSMM